MNEQTEKKAIIQFSLTMALEDFIGELDKQQGIYLHRML